MSARQSAMPPVLPLNYVDVAYDPTQQQYTVWVIQRGHVTSSTKVKSSSTIAVIAKRLCYPVYTGHLDLILVLTQQGITVIADRLGR